MTDIKPVAYEYRRRIGVDDDEIIITHQPPDRVQRVELYEVRPLYPESALTQAREEGRREAGTWPKMHDELGAFIAKVTNAKTAGEADHWFSELRRRYNEQIEAITRASEWKKQHGNKG